MRADNIISKSNLKNASEKSGVYWLYQQSDWGWDVAYVGISKNIRRRLMEHYRTKIFDAFFYEEQEYHSVKEREKFLLSGYKHGRGCLPLLNRQVG